MYKQFFGIQTKPFSIAPDPQFLYMSAGHLEALAHLRYGLSEGGGFVLLTGEIGAGKTTVCRCILEQTPKDTNIAFVLNPKLSAQELVATICDELRIYYPVASGLKPLIDRLNRYLLAAHAQGQRTVLIIDEAQNLSYEVLEQIRLLTNLETNQQRLLQIILLGQPELQEILAQPEMRQLAQRIAARHHLGPLAKDETLAYVRHRLAVAGMEPSVFTIPALDEVFLLSCGIPRMINLICDRALLGAYSKGVRRVDRGLAREAADQVFGLSRHAPLTLISPWIILGWMAVVSIMIIAGLKWSGASNSPGPGVEAAQHQTKVP